MSSPCFTKTTILHQKDKNKNKTKTKNSTRHRCILVQDRTGNKTHNHLPGRERTCREAHPGSHPCKSKARREGVCRARRGEQAQPSASLGAGSWALRGGGCSLAVWNLFLAFVSFTRESFMTVCPWQADGAVSFCQKSFLLLAN